MGKKLEAILFDLDGVITDTAHYHYLAWKKTADALGISIDEKFNEQLKGINRVESLQRILAYGQKQVDEATFERLLYEKNEDYKQLIQQVTHKDILPGILSFLDQLAEHGIKTAIASVSKNAPTILKGLGIIHRFNVIVDPDTVKEGKPAPDIFLEAARLLETPIENCIGIEDAEAGIEALVDAGIFAVGIGGQGLADKGAQLVLKTTEALDLSEITKEFKKEQK